jgi:8-oxo-dGTP pyrophosphatase MutT (NUDIX family)
LGERRATIHEKLERMVSGPVDSPPRRGSPDSGDGWVEGPDGRRFWGLFGAAGLLALDPERGILLQHRAVWSHFGGTWGLPGGARHKGESALEGALREATEEAGVPDGAVRPRFASVFDLGYWSYATVLVDVLEQFDAQATDPESIELKWVALADVDDLPLHPGFEAAWPALRESLTRHAVVIVDAANVVGSRPDGWWKDRAGAAERLVTAMAPLATEGVPAPAFDLPESWWWPEFVVVLEGEGRDATIAETRGITIARAEGSGDDAVVEQVQHAFDAGAEHVVVVTADRGLSDRVERMGAGFTGPRVLLELSGY